MRTGRPRRGTVLVVAIALAAMALALLPSLALAHHGPGSGDPRCPEWRANGAPPGVDVSIVCPAGAVASTTADSDLMPYLGGAVTIAAVLLVVGFVAMRATARPSARRRARSAAGAWWRCPACRSVNAAVRGVCGSCGATQAGLAPALGQRLDA